MTTLSATFASKAPRLTEPAFLDALQCAVADTTSQAVGLKVRPQDVTRTVTRTGDRASVTFSAVIEGEGATRRVRKGRKTVPLGACPEAVNMAVAMAPVPAPTHPEPTP